MSTYGEAVEQAQELATRASQPKLVLKSWECHILIMLVWNPHSLHLFTERLRPEVLKLAEAICDPAKRTGDAQWFIEAVHQRYPTARS